MGQGEECIMCGGPIEGKGRKFCSDGCRIKYYNAKRYRKEGVEICAECGDIIEPLQGQGRPRRYCSSICQVKHKARLARERRHMKEQPEQECPACGKKFQAEFGHGKKRKFCSEACRKEWWRGEAKRRYEMRREQEDEQREEEELAEQEENKAGSSRIEKECPWCGRRFLTYRHRNQIYCSRECAIAGRYQAPFRPGRRHLPVEEAETWKEKLTQAVRESRTGKRGKRVRLVCGATSMYTGLDGLIAIVRCHLRCNPYDGSVYVFRDAIGSMLKYIEWDGQSFIQSKRRAQSGRYPWPDGETGSVVEINEKEFEYLLSRSIIPPFKEKK